MYLSTTLSCSVLKAKLSLQREDEIEDLKQRIRSLEEENVGLKSEVR